MLNRRCSTVFIVDFDRSFIKKVRKIFRKTNISYPLICTGSCAYQGVKNLSFTENFVYVLNEWCLGLHNIFRSIENWRENNLDQGFFPDNYFIRIWERMMKHCLRFPLKYTWTHVIRILWWFGNLFELDDFSNYRSLAISVKFRKKR